MAENISYSRDCAPGKSSKKKIKVDGVRNATACFGGKKISRVFLRPLSCNPQGVCAKKGIDSCPTTPPILAGRAPSLGGAPPAGLRLAMTSSPDLLLPVSHTHEDFLLHETVRAVPSLQRNRVTAFPNPIPQPRALLHSLFSRTKAGRTSPIVPGCLRTAYPETYSLFQRAPSSPSTKTAREK